MFERFTTSAREVVVLSQEEARMLCDDRIGTEHLLLGLLGARPRPGEDDDDGDSGGPATRGTLGKRGRRGRPDNPAAEVLAAQGIGLAAMRTRIEAVRRSGGDGLDADALAAIGIDLDQVRAATEASFGPGALDPKERTRPSGHIAFDASAKKALELSLRHALRLKHDHIGPGHILLGVLHDDDTAAAILLRQAGADLQRLRTEVTSRMDSEAA